MKIGYARVSSYGQSLDIQISKLEAFGCDRIFSDKVIGTSQDRPEMIQCLDYVRDGDQLLITKLGADQVNLSPDADSERLREEAG